MHLGPSFLYCAFLIAFSYCGLTRADPPLVSSRAGTFQGSVLTAPSGQRFAAFTAIPFAEPPVGELRFAKPRPLGPLQGVYYATERAPSCIQARHAMHQDDLGQEDCLYLNVYTPWNSLTQNYRRDGGPKKEVFVYIHGGGWYLGTSADWVPGDLVTQGDIIVVTVNYRLWWLGFLQGRTNQLPGNQALWDHVMALNWVKDNIGAFGGDALDVTIGGESSGGYSASLLLMSEAASGLFSRSIVQSGTLFNNQMKPGDKDGMLEDLANRVGCNHLHGNRTSDGKILSLLTASESDISKVIRCLRDLPAESFIMPVGFDFFLMRMDGDFFPSSIQEIVNDEDYLKRIGFRDKPLLLSITNNEGPIVYWGVWGTTPPTAHDDFEAYGPIADMLEMPREVFDKLIQAYQTTEDREMEPILDIISDLSVLPDSFKTLDLHSKNCDLKTYLMKFDHYPSYMPHPQQGTFHGVDLAYLFDIEPQTVLWMYYYMQPMGPITPADRELKRSYIQLVSDFVKTGVPGQSLNQTWTPYDPCCQAYLRFDSEPRMGWKMTPDRRHIVEELLPQWLREHAERSQDNP